MVGHFDLDRNSCLRKIHAVKKITFYVKILVVNEKFLIQAAPFVGAVTIFKALVLKGC